MTDCSIQITLLPSAARTATVASAKQQHFSCRAIRLYLNVTVAVAGTGGLQPIIRGYDLVSGTAAPLSTGGTAIVATGLYVYEMGLGLLSTAKVGNVEECQNRPAPVEWDVSITVGDATSYTYSLSAEVLV
jgi:hypothetical protein